MSIAEIKEQITALAPEERMELAALIAHLNRADDPGYLSELDRRMAALDEGKKYGQPHLEDLHKDLTSKGR